MGSRLCRVFFAVVLVGWLPPLAAVGLGPVSLHSRLGEPLDATVPLTGAGTAVESMWVAIAAREAFARIGLERVAVLSRVSVSIEDDGTGGGLLRLSSATVINEPLLAVVLELRHEGTAEFHEVTLLLDPVTATGIRAPSVPAAADDAGVARPPAAAPEVVREDMLWVDSGDTLYGVAARVVAARGGELTATALALYRANPNAFIGASADRLIAGVHLRLPKDVAAMPPAQARLQLAASSQRSESPHLGSSSSLAAADAAATESPEAPMPEGGFRLSLLSAEEEAALLPPADPVVMFRSRQEIARLHDDVRVQIAAMESERAERLLAARVASTPKVATVDAPRIHPVVALAASTPTLVAGISATDNATTLGMLDGADRLFDLVLGWAATASDRAVAAVLAPLAVAVLTVLAIGGWELRRRRRMDTLRRRERDPRPSVDLGTVDDDALPDLEFRSDVARPGTGFRGADWLDDTAATFDLSHATGEELERGIDETLSASDACLRHGYDDVAEALLRELMSVCPKSADVRARLLQVLHAAGRRAAFVQEAREFRKLVGVRDPLWRRVCVIGAELAPHEPLFDLCRDSASDAIRTGVSAFASTRAVQVAR